MIKIHVNNKRDPLKSGNFITIACGFKSEITAIIETERINAKSIMRISDIAKAMEIDFMITGEDEDMAAKAIKNYFETI